MKFLIFSGGAGSLGASSGVRRAPQDVKRQRIQSAMGTSEGSLRRTFLVFLRPFYSLSLDMDLNDLCLLLLLGPFYSECQYMRFSLSQAVLQGPFVFFNIQAFL